VRAVGGSGRWKVVTLRGGVRLDLVAPRLGDPGYGFAEKAMDLDVRDPRRRDGARGRAEGFSGRRFVTVFEGKVG